MARRKFTVILIPDEEGYQVIVSHYPECATWGETPKEVFKNAKEAMELILETEAENGVFPLPPNVHAAHLVVGDIEVEVPESLLNSEDPIKADVVD